jgi:hypothetical protein
LRQVRVYNYRTGQPHGIMGRNSIRNTAPLLRHHYERQRLVSFNNERRNL